MEFTEEEKKLLTYFEKNHKEFSKLLIDAAVLITQSQKILYFNQSFALLVKSKPIEIKKNPFLFEKLKFPTEQDFSLEELLKSPSPQRFDEVQLQVLTGSNDHLNVIMSHYPYTIDNELIGHCILIRDVTAEEALQGKYQEKTRLSVTDSLTGLYSRRYFETWIQEEMKKEGEVNIGVLMFDLDKFKHINDSYGHAAGDFVLVETAKVLKKNSRSTDLIARYGGEEIIIFLGSSQPKGTAIAAEKFRKSIENHVFEFQGKVIPVTTSVGGSFIKVSTEDPAQVIAKADGCLYEAKKDSRNCCYVNFVGTPEKAIKYIE